MFEQERTIKIVFCWWPCKQDTIRHTYSKGPEWNIYGNLRGNGICMYLCIKTKPPNGGLTNKQGGIGTEMDEIHEANHSMCC